MLLVPSHGAAAKPVEHPVIRRYTAGQNGGPCGRADRRGTVEVLKPHSFLCHLIQRRRTQLRGSCTAESPRALIIRHDQVDVGSIPHRGSLRPSAAQLDLIQDDL